MGPPMHIETDCEVIVFCSSSGHCQLDCGYCIVQPIVKRKPSLTIADFRFLLDALGRERKTLLILSGKGDFFAGYGRSERLLAQLLERDVELILDINGLLIHEFAELDDASLAKLRMINLTLHYRQIKQRGAQATWVRNAEILLGREGPEQLVGLILCPDETDLWEEAVMFYAETVFASTGKPLTLIRDVTAPFDDALEAYQVALQTQYPEVVGGVYVENVPEFFARHPQVLCPAGATYLRVWNDGRVEGCPFVPALAGLGQLKSGQLALRDGPILCDTPHHCDCHTIAHMGRMGYPSSEASSASMSSLS